MSATKRLAILVTIAEVCGSLISGFYAYQLYVRDEQIFSSITLATMAVILAICAILGFREAVRTWKYL